MGGLAVALTLVLGGVAALPAAADPAGQITEVAAGGVTPGFSVNNGPTGIAAGPDGNLWFTEAGSPGAIGRITPASTVTEFGTGLTADSGLFGITAGPDGNLWFTEENSPGRIGRITPGAPNTITEFSTGLTVNSAPGGITAGPDGNVWFTEQFGGIGRITPAGVITEFSTGLTVNSQPAGITAGPDGNLWFTEFVRGGQIGRITPAGEITEFSTGLTVDSGPIGITAGPDGNLWFTEANNPGRIGRITPVAPNTITEFSTGLTANSRPLGITAGCGGNLWFTEANDPGRIGRITPGAPNTITEFSTGLTANSGPVGIAAGPGGNLWFTEQGPPGRIAKIGAGWTRCRLPAGVFSTPTGHRRNASGVFATAGNAEGTVQFPAAGAGSPITVTGLNNGTHYSFTVTAIDTSGRGATSSQSNEVAPEARTPAARLTRGAASAPRPGGGIPWMTPLMGVLLCALLMLGCLAARSRRTSRVMSGTPCGRGGT
jgi:streptogramin lyase